MRNAYHDRLDEVSDDLVEMSRLVGQAIARATTALLDADLALAEQVIAGDEAIDAMTAKVEQDSYQVAALQQPVATDLRVVVAALRISASLERMGDLAAHVAKQARMRYPATAVPAQLRDTFAAMGAVAQSVAEKTGQVIATKDVALAGDIARADEAMDEHHRELFRTVLSDEWSDGIETAVDITLLSRYYERFADHAVTIAKRVVYVVTGEPYATVDPESAASELGRF